MTSSFRFVATTLALATLSFSGCGAPVVCNCPADLPGRVVVPADSSRPLGVVLTDEFECVASDSGAVAGGRQVTVNRSTTGTCHVRAELWNGEGAYTFTVEFQSLGGCCAGLARAVATSIPQPVTAAGG